MNLLIAGASGFIGHCLVAAMQDSNKLTVLGRDKQKLTKDFGAKCTIISWDELKTIDAKGFDVVINLCGFNISGARWSQRVKKELIDSRVTTSDALIRWLIGQQAKPHFICANAVGIYGLQENGSKEFFDEDSTIDFDNPRDFMSEIGVRWQQALQPALDYGMPVTTMRFGVVLSIKGGMLKKLLPSFYLGLGSVIGDGSQMLSWIAMDDLIAAIRFLIERPALTGAFNLSSPNPVCQAKFAKTLSLVLHRPLFLKLPSFMVQLLFGEMGQSLLLQGQAVLPKRLVHEGFKFEFPELEQALMHVVQQ